MHREEGFDDKSMEGSDLTANGEHILAGGSLSILRRKGKHFKDRREKVEDAKGANKEILSNNI